MPKIKLVKENTYLELLKKQIDKINFVVNQKKYLVDQDNNKEKNNAYNCALAGLLIQANCILESALMDFHSPEFNTVASKIYKYRQLLVHYRDYTAFDNVEKLSEDIIKEFKNQHKSEKGYFAERLNRLNTDKEYNLYIKKNKNIEYDSFTHSYSFNSDDGIIYVSEDKVKVVKQYKTNKILAYIVNCNVDMNYARDDETLGLIYTQLEAPSKLKEFFKQRFTILDEDNIDYKKMIIDVARNLYSGSFSTLKVENITENDKKSIYADSAKVLNDYFNKDIVYDEFLKERKFSSPTPPSVFIQKYRINTLNLDNNLSERDLFFINRTIHKYNKLHKDLIENKRLVGNSDLEYEMTVAMYINFVDQTLKNISDHFVKSDEGFEELYVKLIDYRNFFAHNIYQLKPNLCDRVLDEFKDICAEFVNVLSSLEFNNNSSKSDSTVISCPIESRNLSFVAVERPPEAFVNSKYEQYVEVDPTTYMGDRLFYSTRGSEYDKIIGLVPNDKRGDFHGAFYDRIGNDFIVRSYKMKKSNKKKTLFVTKVNFEGGEDVCMDVNLKELFYINAAYCGKVNDEDTLGKLPNFKKLYVVFAESKENNNKSHVASLDSIITNYFQQRYIPFELAKIYHHKLVQDETGKFYFELYDENDNLIGAVVNERLLRRKGEFKEDPKEVFTVTNIEHVLSKNGGRKK